MRVRLRFQVGVILGVGTEAKTGIGVQARFGSTCTPLIES